MTKASLAQAVATQLVVSKEKAELVVETVLAQLVGALQRGQEVELRGFGSFRFRTRNARKARNPKTGAAVDVEAKTVVYFKMGRELKAFLGAAPPEAVREP